ncbi:hypothetical protein [Moorena sp. SIOASIH]|uniref:hypothetical protein n=1 Tax=Moorena sp. SIOASIH TaxID=2607817 RepID=UPI0025EED4BA|nr:hypothetical protein [Moorena sp. SIOASIH]
MGFGDAIRQSLCYGNASLFIPTGYSGAHSNEVHRIFPHFRLPCSLLPAPFFFIGAILATQTEETVL